MRILEELYYRGVSLRKAAKQPSALHEKLREGLTTNDRRMLAMLMDEQKIQFEKCPDAAEEISDLVEREAFCQQLLPRGESHGGGYGYDGNTGYRRVGKTHSLRRNNQRDTTTLCLL